ncbi:MAG TPA: Gfo/Idh/MocA family oxidoreductase [Bryobacterales bacterium]|jgi:predicted dehydrogenase|nr:Gfo/Idh/MocA family oxidoreductase [Bryobacterales bacterium]
MTSRRNFIGKVSVGVAGTIATMTPAARILGANDRIRLGLIGAGARGQQILREALACPNTELVAVADVYRRRHEECRLIAPSARAHFDHREMLEDPSIDAVLIATPQHLHAEHCVAALEAGRHVYLENTMAFTVDQAKRVRLAFQRAGRVLQIGHQACSSGQVEDVRQILATGLVGRITEIHAWAYRNTPHGRPHWARPVYPDMKPENVHWSMFLGEAPQREFDPNRFINWRLFFDYSGGSIYENMSHQAAFWYKALDLRIPRAVTTRGGIYHWRDGREAPDTLHVIMEQPEEMLFTWSSGLANGHLGSSEEALGSDGTIVRSRQVRYIPEKVNQPRTSEMLGSNRGGTHMQNFLDCIRSGKDPNCPFEIGFCTSIACRMALESYLQGRTVIWDDRREAIV